MKLQRKLPFLFASPLPRRVHLGAGADGTVGSLPDPLSSKSANDAEAAVNTLLAVLYISCVVSVAAALVQASQIPLGELLRGLRYGHPASYFEGAAQTALATLLLLLGGVLGVVRNSSIPTWAGIFTALALQIAIR